MELNSVSGIAQNLSPSKVQNTNRTERVAYNNELKSDTVSFTGKKSKDKAEKKSGVAHKAVVASTSMLIPGLGQAINGQWGKALLCYAGFDITSFAIFLVTGNPFIASAVALGGRAFSVIDAYRNA